MRWGQLLKHPKDPQGVITIAYPPEVMSILVAIYGLSSEDLDKLRAGLLNIGMVVRDDAGSGGASSGVRHPRRPSPIAGGAVAYADEDD